MAGGHHPEGSEGTAPSPKKGKRREVTEFEGQESPRARGDGHKQLVFQNYLGIGVDAQAALRFHRTRNISPHLFFSAFTNKILYGLFGARDVVEHSCAGLHQHVHVIADGVRCELPPETEGIILLNINSFAGGVRMWESRGVRRELHAGRDGGRGGGVWGTAPRAAQLGGGRLCAICQARNVKVIVERGFPMHVDGEPWEQPACTIDIKLRNKALMLRRTADARGMSIVKMADTRVGQGQRHHQQRKQTEAYHVRGVQTRGEGQIKSMAHQRSNSLGNLVSRHRRGRSGGSDDIDFY